MESWRGREKGAPCEVPHRGGWKELTDFNSVWGPFLVPFFYPCRDAYPLLTPNQRITQWKYSPGPVRILVLIFNLFFLISSSILLPILGHLLKARKTEMAPNSLL